ncbi:uncharacterized protein LOC130540598 [Pan paniscus]|uniref:uncharacterized protein LOC107967345 n=1 Tax=Pan troglodytes TaxID=9598 RepID=UPI000036F1F4|nr:uncharacterized protein LOC107967345 [Pan troglodytes]XP_057155156.1 uncharacterized protein LOC130540598 [Pan paniscus]
MAGLAAAVGVATPPHFPGSLPPSLEKHPQPMEPQYLTAEGREQQEGPQEASPKDGMLWEDAPLAPGDWSPLRRPLARGGRAAAQASACGHLGQDSGGRGCLARLISLMLRDRWENSHEKDVEWEGCH